MRARDLDVALRAANAASEAVLAALRSPVHIEEKTAPTDLVTDADRAGEDAAAAVLAAERPRDGLRGEEGHRSPGRREWLIDPVDGTLNLVRGLPGWTSVVGLWADGEAEAAVIRDAVANQTFAAARGHGARRDGAHMAVREGCGLDGAVVATYLQPAKRGLPGVRDVNRALVSGVGALRAGAGSGNLELAWVADGRIDGWVQPDLEPWDWVPGALLVREAGGRTAEFRPRPDGPVWCVAGTPSVCDALVDLVCRAAAEG